MTTENNSAAALGDDWVVVLLGNRTLLGKYVPGDEFSSGPSSRPHLSPVYQIETRPQPQQGAGPDGKPVVIMTRPRFVMAVAEMDGWDSLELPDSGIVVKPVAELPVKYQKECASLMHNYESAKEASRRKVLIDEQAAAAMRSANFGGGARKDES